MLQLITSKIKWILGGVAFLCGGFLIAFYKGKKSQWENTLIEQVEAEREMDEKIKKANSEYKKNIKSINDEYNGNIHDRLLAKARLINRLSKKPEPTN